MIQVFKVLYENASNTFHVGAHLAILIAIRDVCKLVVKELTSWVWSSLKLIVPSGVAFWKPFIPSTFITFSSFASLLLSLFTYLISSFGYTYIHAHIYPH